jgi:hypothetical protein
MVTLAATAGLHPPATRLAYPAGALLVVAGIPGAGKSTLLRRVFAGSGGPAVFDPEQVAARWRRVPVPYGWYRPFVHAEHYVRAALALWRHPGAIVLHETGTRGKVRRVIATLAALAGRPAYLLWIDVDLDEARHGQRRRGRMLRPESMLRHWRRWTRLRDRLTAGRGDLHREGYQGVVMLSRADAALIDAITFTG